MPETLFGLAAIVAAVALCVLVVWMVAAPPIAPTDPVITPPDLHLNCRCAPVPVFSKGSNTPTQVRIENPPPSAAPVLPGLFGGTEPVGPPMDCLAEPVPAEDVTPPAEFIDFHYYDYDTPEPKPLPPFACLQDRATDTCYIGRLNDQGAYVFDGETVTVMPDLWEGDNA